MDSSAHQRSLSALGNLIFFSRWLQAPLYLGLIVAQGAYVYRFMIELWHLIMVASGPGEEKEVMIIVLKLIDVVMISNLLIMVIVGGYETFVSRLRLDKHPDQPEWLSHVNAGVLKASWPPRSSAFPPFICSPLSSTSAAKVEPPPRTFFGR